jgi:hypothetical protein
MSDNQSPLDTSHLIELYNEGRINDIAKLLQIYGDHEDKIIESYKGTYYVKENGVICSKNGKISSDPIISKLFSYSIKNNEAEFLKKLITDNESYGFWYFDRENKNAQMLIRNNHKKIRDIIFEMMYLPPNTINQFYKIAITNHNNDYLEILEQHQYIMQDEFVGYCIRANHIDIVTYALERNYDIQSIFNNIEFCCDMMYIFNLKMLVFLINHSIDVSDQLRNILKFGAYCNDLELVQFCVETIGANIDDFNAILRKSFQSNSTEMMTYALQLGADINTIKDDDWSTIINVAIEEFTKVRKTLDLLVTNSYHFSSSILDKFLLQYFVNGNIENIQYIIDLGADPNYIFSIEDSDSVYLFDGKPGSGRWKLKSCLEYVIYEGNIDQLKLLANICFDQLKLELDRLFIISIANGREFIAKFLLELGANIKAFNCIALDVSCYFGHYHMLIFLLEQGLDLNMASHNLFMMTAYANSGYRYVKNGRQMTYSTFGFGKINDHRIFRDGLESFGNSHKEIFGLLIKNNYSPPSYKFFNVIVEDFFSIELFTYMLEHNVHPQTKNLYRYGEDNFGKILDLLKEYGIVPEDK